MALFLRAEFVKQGLIKRQLSRFLNCTVPLRSRPSDVYWKEVRNGNFREDPRQTLALRHLDKLYDDLKKYVPPSKSSGQVPTGAKKAASSKTWFSTLFSKSEPAQPLQKKEKVFGFFSLSDVPMCVLDV